MATDAINKSRIHHFKNKGKDQDVTAVPAVVAIKDGQIVDRFIGLQEEDKIKGFLDKIIGSGKKS